MITIKEMWRRAAEMRRDCDHGSLFWLIRAHALIKLFESETAKDEGREPRDIDMMDYFPKQIQDLIESKEGGPLLDIIRK